jgi:hypothetical protein
MKYRLLIATSWLPIALAGAALAECDAANEALPNGAAVKERVPGKEDEEWTPERMQKARPMPMPAPEQIPPASPRAPGSPRQPIQGEEGQAPSDD